MIETLSEQQRKWLALGILALAVLVLVSLTVAPVWSTNRHYQDTITQLQERLERTRRIVAVGNQLQSQLDRLKRSQAAVAHTLESRTPALAGAELQRILNRIVAANDADVLSTQILPSREEQEFVRIALKVRMRGSLQGLVEAFYALETGEPFLFLDNVSIRSLYRRARGPSAAISTLETDFELIGYIPRGS